MKKVYISSPYVGDNDQDMERLRDHAEWALSQEVEPVAVYLDGPQLLLNEPPHEREVLNAAEHKALLSCDELWFFGDAITPSMSAEITTAKRMGKPVRYVSSRELREQGAISFGISMKM